MSPGAGFVDALSQVADALERGDTDAAERANVVVEAARDAGVPLTRDEQVAARRAFDRALAAAIRARDDLGPELARVATARRTQDAYERSG